VYIKVVDYKQLLLVVGTQTYPYIIYFYYFYSKSITDVIVKFCLIGTGVFTIGPLGPCPPFGPSTKNLAN